MEGKGREAQDGTELLYVRGLLLCGAQGQVCKSSNTLQKGLEGGMSKFKVQSVHKLVWQPTLHTTLSPVECGLPNFCWHLPVALEVPRMPKDWLEPASTNGPSKKLLDAAACCGLLRHASALLVYGRIVIPSASQPVQSHHILP